MCLNVLYILHTNIILPCIRRIRDIILQQSATLQIPILHHSLHRRRPIIPMQPILTV